MLIFQCFPKPFYLKPGRFLKHFFGIPPFCSGYSSYFRCFPWHNNGSGSSPGNTVNFGNVTLNRIGFLYIMLKQMSWNSFYFVPDRIRISSGQILNYIEKSVLMTRAGFLMRRGFHDLLRKTEITLNKDSFTVLKKTISPTRCRSRQQILRCRGWHCFSST